MHIIFHLVFTFHLRVNKEHVLLKIRVFILLKVSQLYIKIVAYKIYVYNVCHLTNLINSLATLFAGAIYASLQIQI